MREQILFYIGLYEIDGSCDCEECSDMQADIIRWLKEAAE